MSTFGVGTRAARSADNPPATYSRRQFVLYERIICAGDTTALDLPDEAPAPDSASTERLTFAQWLRELEPDPGDGAGRGQFR